MNQLVESLPSPGGGGGFPATRWSLFVKLQGGAERGDGCPEKALGELLKAYWQPLYSFARRAGLSGEDAEDSVQGFCETLIRRQSLRAAGPALGKLRSFLLRGFQNHLKDQWRSSHRGQRGGNSIHLSLEAAEETYGRQASREPGPEQAFEKQWVMTLLERTLARLREEFASRGKERHFTLLEGALAWNGCEISHAEIAENLGLSLAAVQQAVVRMRARYRKLLEEEISQTVTEPGTVEEERLYLIQVLSK